MKNLESRVKRTAVIMAMPVKIELRIENEELRDQNKTEEDINEVFEYLRWVDETFSPFKENSEVSKYNRGKKYSDDLKKILKLCEETKKLTGGYFDIIRPDGKMDPSGLVKGWAIWNAAKILKKAGYKKYFVEVAGDTEISGGPWKWGITNPFNKKEIIKVLNLSNCGIATSGTYERGQHIWNSITKKAEITDIVSLTVIGPNVYEADRYATAAFAMGRSGIEFIEKLKGLPAGRQGFEGYMIDKDGIAIMTTGFKKYVETI